MNVLYVEKDPYAVRSFLCKLIPILYGSFLYTTTYGSFLCTKFPILYGSFLCTKPPIYMGPSYVLLHPFYIRWSLYIKSQKSLPNANKHM